MGRYYHYRTEHRKSIEFLERARHLAEPLEDAGTLGAIYSFLAGAHQHLLTYDESDDWSRISIAFGERKKFPHAIANGYEFLAENARAVDIGVRRLPTPSAIESSAQEWFARTGSLGRFPTVQALHGKGDLLAARRWRNRHCGPHRADR